MPGRVVAHDLEATMATMTAEPNVNHVPVMTGGRGQAEIRRFYRHHLIPANPPDTALELISRTVGAERIVDEMIFKFTHSCAMDWMLPGVAPTGRRVEIPLVAIIGFQDGKVASEHIYWDQASVLVQIGMLDPDGLPVAGAATAAKLRDPTLPSNALMPDWPASRDEPA